MVLQSRFDVIERNPLAIAKARILHVSSRILLACHHSPRSSSLEFEMRYRRYLAEFGESESDIIISTFSKSGTTWMQMILYQLTTGGQMDFDHLFDISPWIWYAALRNTQPAKTPAPRLLKSHDRYGRFAGGRKGRFVFVVRDGRDVCLSLFHHRRNFKRYDGSFEQHFDEFINGTEYNWFDHIRPWLDNRSGLPIIYIRFEDLKNDFSHTVSRLAENLGIPVTAETMARVTERCSFDFMKRHEARFAPRNEHFSGMAGVPYHVRNPDQFIRHGIVGEGVATLSPSQLATYRDRFDKTLSDIPLIADYR